MVIELATVQQQIPDIQSEKKETKANKYDRKICLTFRSSDFVAYLTPFSIYIISILSASSLFTYKSRLQPFGIGTNKTITVNVKNG